MALRFQLSRNGTVTTLWHFRKLSECSYTAATSREGGTALSQPDQHRGTKVTDIIRPLPGITLIANVIRVDTERPRWMLWVSAIAVAVVAGAAMLLSLGSTPAASITEQSVAPGPPPEALPFALRDVEPMTAMEINQKIPYSTEPNPAAKPFKIRGDDLAYVRALECLTATIYYEAAHEPADGQRAVAQVVLNRVRHPAFPKGVCEVTFQGSTRRTGCQFTFTCDGALRRQPDTTLWAHARAVAAAALGGAVFTPVGNATHYHANYVVPYWATELAKNAVVGTHIFYRWPGWWGQPAAFRRRHSGEEADPRVLRHIALKARSRLPAEILPVGTDPRLELISIVHLLAGEDLEKRKLTQYQNEVREHFSSFSNHVAVQIYRQLVAANSKFGPETVLSSLMHHPNPREIELSGTVHRDVVEAAGGAEIYSGFITALSDFAAHSSFRKFYEKRLPYYAKLQEEAHAPTARLLATVERDTGGDAQKVRLLLAPLLETLSASGCAQSKTKKLEMWIVVSAAGLPKKTFENHAELAKSIARYSGKC